MFTGIIQSIGSIVGIDRRRDECRLGVGVAEMDLAGVAVGDSIAVSGCCLTVIEFTTEGFTADVSRETLRCTTLGSLQAGSKVNLELAMQAGDRFGGHIVSGHVDGVGILLDLTPEGGSMKMQFQAPQDLARYIAAKGSICIDGTSLTVNEVVGETFAINVIPHTQSATIMGDYRQGQKVNLEVDVVARYLERLMVFRSGDESNDARLSKDFLEQHGFGSD